MYSNVKNLTPDSMICRGMGCPSIYLSLKDCDIKLDNANTNLTKFSNYCKEEVYLIIGKKINASKIKDKMIKDKIGKGEVLIEIPKKLIDEKKVVCK